MKGRTAYFIRPKGGKAYGIARNLDQMPSCMKHGTGKVILMPTNDRYTPIQGAKKIFIDAHRLTFTGFID
jgi:hypothetical protein